MIGAMFHIDPAAVLAETDPLRRIVRVACHNIVARSKVKQPAEVDIDGL